MRANRIILLALALWFTATAATFADNALMGTWKLNESKSKFAPGAAKNTSVVYSPTEGDMIKCTADGTDKDGRPIHWTPGWGNSMANRTGLKGARRAAHFYRPQTRS